MSDAVVDVEGYVAAIVDSRLSSKTIARLALSGHSVDETRGYALQRLAAARLTIEGLGPIIGYKLGMTTPELQARFGIREPLFGPIHRSGLVLQESRFDMSRMRRIGLECEVAVTMGRDLPRRSTPYDAAAVLAAIETFHAGIEVVEDRFDDISTASPWAIVAEGVLHRACALGPGLSRWPSGKLTGALWLEDQQLATGNADSLFGGGPLTAVSWLANKLNAHGGMLKAGNIVLCGSIAPVAWLDGPSTAGTLCARVPHLGEATLRFVERDLR